MKPELATTARVVRGSQDRRRRQLWAVLALLAALVVSLATWYAVQQREIVEREALARVGLYARVLEGQASRSFSAAAQMLRSLANRGTVRRADSDANTADRLLDQHLLGQPYLRSLAIADEAGRVLVSTNEADIGRLVDLDALGRESADADGQAIGTVLPIRQLADLGSAVAPSASTALPLLRRVPMEGDLASHWLVALINPDYFATQHSLIAAGSNVQVLMSDLRGRVISAAGDAASTARGIESLPPFTRFLPLREHGGYLGPGSDGADAVAAFRVSPQWPLLILTEEPLHVVMAVWRGRAGGAASIAIGAVALLAALGWAIDRSLRREQAALERTDRLNRELVETEQRWKLALDGAGHVVWDMDLGSQEITVSPRVSELLGYGADDPRWTAARLRASIHPEDLERTTRIIESHVRGELQHYEDELRLRTRTGEWKWVLSRAAMVGGDGGDGQGPRLIGTMTDIDMRKAAETALRESEARQQAILNSALDGIVIVDQLGQVLQFNPAAEAMFGRRQADSAGKPMHELIVPPKYRDAHQAGMARYQATGEGPVLNRRIEIEALRVDGAVFPVELTIVPVRTGAGEIFTATLRDITERRRIEAALRDSEARAKAAFEQAAVGVLEVDFDHRPLRVNQRLCTMLGYTREELLSLRMTDIVHPLDLAAGSDGIRAVTQGETAHFSADRRYRRKNGSYVWVRLTASPALDGEGRPTHLIAVIEDISARRQAEDALRDSQGLLDKTGQIGGVGGWQYDVATDVVTSTAQACRIHEIPPGTQGTLAQTLAFYAPEAQPVIRAAVQRCIDLGEDFDVELPFVTARGRSIWVRALGTAETRDGRVVRLVGALQDVTERRRASKELLDARQRELQVGARIQQSLLVTTPPADLAGLQISSFSQASQGIDGDFVEVIRVGDDCVDFIAGDVMGKGLPAAMMGAATKLQFSRSFTELLMAPGTSGKAPRPAEVVAAVHRAMTPALQALDAFVTLCYLRIDTRRHTVTWVGCGHEETLCVGGGEVRALANQHPPLGVLDGADYREDEQPMRPGELLLLYSDGVTDALRADGERVGRERVVDAVARRAGLHTTPGAVLHALRADLLPRGVQMQDDLTMVVVQYPVAPVRRIELPANMAAIRQLREFVASMTCNEDLGEARAGLAEVACVEAFTNIVRHGQGRLEGAPIEVVARREAGAMVLELVHLGAAYSPPAEVPDTDFALFPEGGFGLSIIRRACDDVAYLHEAGINTVRMTCGLG